MADTKKEIGTETVQGVDPRFEQYVDKTNPGALAHAERERQFFETTNESALPARAAKKANSEGRF